MKQKDKETQLSLLLLQLELKLLVFELNELEEQLSLATDEDIQLLDALEDELKKDDDREHFPLLLALLEQTLLEEEDDIRVLNFILQEQLDDFEL